MKNTHTNTYQFNSSPPHLLILSILLILFILLMLLLIPLLLLLFARVTTVVAVLYCCSSNRLAIHKLVELGVLLGWADSPTKVQVRTRYYFFLLFFLLLRIILFPVITTRANANIRYSWSVCVKISYILKPSNTPRLERCSVHEAKSGKKEYLNHKTCHMASKICIVLFCLGCTLLIGFVRLATAGAPRVSDAPRPRPQL